VVARLKASARLSSGPLLIRRSDPPARAGAGRQFGVKAALIVFGDGGALRLVAFVEEGEAEGEADIVEDARVLGPGQHRARRHHRRDIAIDEAGARQIGEGHHALDFLARRLVGGVDAELGEHDRGFLDVRQVVQRGDDVPAVHLALVDLLRAVIEPGGIAKPDGVGGGKQTEGAMRTDHPVLIEQGELAVDLEHALDDEHHVRPAGVVFVEHQGARVL